MDCKSTTELTMPTPPPAYSSMPKVSTTQRRIILASVMVILLGFFIVAGTLVGVHLTQKHTEKVLDMVIQGNKGEEEEQTAMVNERENVAAFHIKRKKSTATVVYNYNQGLIGLRITNSKKCFVLKMDKLNIPSLDEISRDLPHFNAKVSGDKMSYNFTEAEPADRTTLGTTLNILCSDIPIYWALPLPGHFSGVRKGDNSISEAKVEERITPQPATVKQNVMIWGFSTRSAWTFTLQHHQVMTYLIQTCLRREDVPLFN